MAMTSPPLMGIPKGPASEAIPPEWRGLHASRPAGGPGGAAPRLSICAAGAFLVALLGGGAGTVLAAQDDPPNRGAAAGPQWTTDQIIALAAQGRAEMERFQAALTVRRVPTHSPANVYEGTAWFDRGNPDPANGRPARLALELGNAYGPIERQWIFADHRLKVDDDTQRYEEVSPVGTPRAWNEAVFLFFGLDPRLKDHFDFNILEVAGDWTYRHSDYERGTWDEVHHFDQTQIVLMPKSRDAQKFRQVALTLDGTSWIVTRIAIQERSGREVELLLSDIRPLDDARRLQRPSSEELNQRGYRPW